MRTHYFIYILFQLSIWRHSFDVTKDGALYVFVGFFTGTSDEIIDNVRLDFKFTQHSREKWLTVLSSLIKGKVRI